MYKKVTLEQCVLVIVKPNCNLFYGHRNRFQPWLCRFRIGS